MSPPGERGRSVLSNQVLPVMPGMNSVRWLSNSPPSVITLPSVNPLILWPRWVSMSRRFISRSSPFTARGPRRFPGLGAGVKKTSLKWGRLPSRRSFWSMPKRNSNMGPPRIAEGSFGLPAKPMAMVPLCIRFSRSLIRTAAGMPSQGVMTCSMPGSFRMKRPPVAMIRPSFSISAPASVTSRRPPSARVAALPRW